MPSDNDFKEIVVMTKIWQTIFLSNPNVHIPGMLEAGGGQGGGRTPHKGLRAEKVHKPPLEVNVINFELNGFNAYRSLGVTETPKS